MSGFLTTHELHAKRRQHISNCEMLRAAIPAMDVDARLRAETTLSNLMQQVYDIDAELQMATGRTGAIA